MLRSGMRRNPKASIDPIRASKRIAKAKNVMNPIVAIEAINKNPKVAGSEVITRKTTLVPKIADEPTMTKKIKASNKTADTKRSKRPFASKVPETDSNYKTLYFDSQKKVEDLTELNHKQAIDLSYRSGQVDAYEYIIGNMKNVVAFSSTMRATDEEMNLSKGTAPDGPSLNLNHLE
ncbi:uncharacterized protein LOC107013753 [Solanum pennellii]|uniref:Uncharacterized protein LOC107013753 n=1 Tax=Solanum pennellii TaxID=28526 RepID=A0ABM1GCC7_SOLPN|nr:uncharacterized protein LOC107013753 [Solanum pennellii]